MPRIPQSQSAGALPGVGKATSGLQQNGGFVLDSSRDLSRDLSRMTWGTVNSDGPTAAMVKGWPRWAIPGKSFGHPTDCSSSHFHELQSDHWSKLEPKQLYDDCDGTIFYTHNM